MIDFYLCNLGIIKSFNCMLFHIKHVQIFIFDSKMIFIEMDIIFERKSKVDKMKIEIDETHVKCNDFFVLRYIIDRVYVMDNFT